MKLILLILSFQFIFVFSIELEKDISELIAEDYKCLDVYYGDNIFFESKNGNYIKSFTIFSTDTLGVPQYLNGSYLTILEVKLVLQEKLLREGRLIEILDTLNYSFVNYQNKYYRLFGFFMTDILIANSLIKNDFLNILSKVLVNNKVINKRQARLWRRSIIRGQFLHEKVGKPCQILNLFGDLIPEDKKTSLVRNFNAPLTI